MERIQTIVAKLLKTGGWQLLLFSVGLPVFASIEAWPVSVYFILVGGIWYFTHNSTSILTKAARSVAGPVAIGLAATTALLLAYNLFGLVDASEMRGIEAIVLRCALYAKEHELSLRSTLIVLCVLTGLAFLLPQARTITNFVRFQQMWSKTTAVLLTTASFTFFTNETFLTPVAADINEQLFASYRMARVEETISISYCLAMRAEILALKSSSPADRIYVRVLSSILQHSMQHFFSWEPGLVDQQLVEKRGGIRVETLDHTYEKLYNLLTHKIVSFSDVDQAWKDKAGAEKVSGQVKEALKEVVNQSLGAVNDQLRDAVQHHLLSTVYETGDFFTDAAAKYIDHITALSQEHVTDPIIDKGAELYRRLFVAPKQEGIIDISSLAHLEIARACEGAEAAQIQKALAEAGEARRNTKLSSSELNPFRKFRHEEVAQESANEAARSMALADKLGRVSKVQADEFAHLGRTGVQGQEIEAIARTAKTAEDASRVVRMAEAAADEPVEAGIVRVADQAIEEGAKLLRFAHDEE